MSGFPSVARVLLVAVEARALELAPSLRVVGAPVRYDLDRAEPALARPCAEPTWSVVVIDGASIAADDEREQLLQRMSGQPFGALLYIVNRLPGDAEVQQAFAWADDAIEQGWGFEDRLRRRVQSVALAPWRRSMAARAEAERLGDRRVRVVRFSDPSAGEGRSGASSGSPAARRLERALPFVLAEKAWKLGGAAPALVGAAFHEGRRVGVASARENAETLCDQLLRELDRSLESAPPELVRELEAPFRAASGSPILAARFGGAAWAVTVIRDELRRLTRTELAAIERHEVRSGHEP